MAGISAGHSCLHSSLLHQVASSGMSCAKTSTFPTPVPGPIVPAAPSSSQVTGAAGMSARADNFRVIGDPFTMSAAVFGPALSHTATRGICAFLGVSHGPPLPVAARRTGAHRLCRSMQDQPQTVVRQQTPRLTLTSASARSNTARTPASRKQSLTRCHATGTCAGNRCSWEY
jgi:hypothetical protein